MIFSYSGGTTEVRNPQWGYKSIIKLSLIASEVLPRGYVIWDNGVANDYRVCKFTALLNSTQTQDLIDVYTDDARGTNVTLILDTNSGFYPFGPDLGDAGSFSVRILNINANPVLEEPWQYFNTEIEMVMVSSPSYSLPTEVSEGDLQIGSITGLRYPPTFPRSVSSHFVSNIINDGGTPFSIDKTNQGDKLETTLSMLCNQSKAAALIDHLVNTVRDSNVSIVAGTRNWIFGNEGGTSGTYTCKFLNNTISINHEYYNGFSFDISFYRIS